MSLSARFDVRHLPAEVARPLRRYRRRTALYRCARVLLGTFCVWWLGAMIVAHLDRFLFLDTDLRAGLSLGVHALAALLGLGWLAMIWLRRPTTAQVAYALESRLAGGNMELFVTLDSTTRDTPPQGEHTADLRASLLERSRRVGERVCGARLVPLRPLLRPMLAAGIAAAATVALWLAPGYQFPLMAERFLLPGRNLPKPSFIRVQIVPRGVVPSSDAEDSAMVGKGQDVLLEARISGRMPRPVAWLMERLGHCPSRCVLAIGDQDGGELSFAIDSAAGNEVIRMGRARQDLFVHIRRQVGESFQYQVRCGDAQTRRQAVRMVVQPRVTDVELTTTPPEYSRLPAQTLADPRYPDPNRPDHLAAVPLLPGTRAVLHFAADQGECTGSLLIRGTDGTPARVSPEWDPDRQRWRYEIAFDQPQMDLRIAVANRHGFECVSPYDFSLVRREDARPTVRLVEVEGGIEAVAGELVHIPFEATDDLGLAEIAVEQVIEEGRRETTREFPVELEEDGIAHVSMRAPFDLAAVDVRPGQQMRVRIRATDTAGNVGTSPEMIVQVTSFTRGENERDRLRALMFFRDSLRVLADAPPAGADGELIADVRQAITELSSEYEVPLQARFDLADLLGILETQQHCAPTIGSRDDLRRLYVQVLAVCGTNAGKVRAGRCRELADYLDRLIQFRHVANMHWRTFGLRYELRRIRAEMVDLILHGGDPPPQARVEALQRRVALYGESLVAIGAEWRSLPGIEAQQVGPILDTFDNSMQSLSFDTAVQRSEEGAQAFRNLVADRRAEEETQESKEKNGEDKPLTREDLFTASGRDRAASALRGKLARDWRERMEHKQVIARHVARPLDEMDAAFGALIDRGRRVLPEALDARNTARQQLQEGYRRLLTEVSGQFKDATAPLDADSRKWLAAEARLLGWSPFAPVLPRFRAILPAGEEGNSSQLASLFNPPEHIKDAMDAERRAMAALEFQWRVEHLHNQDRLSEYERDLEFLLMLAADGGEAGLLAAGERQELTRRVAEASPEALRRTAMKRRLPQLLAVEEIPDFMAFCRDVQSLRGGLKREHPHWQPVASIRGAIQRVRHGDAGPPAHRGDTYQALMNMTESGPHHSGPIVLSEVIKAGEATDEEKRLIVEGLNKALRDRRFFGRLSPEREEAIGLSPETMAISRRAKALEVLSDVGLGGVSPREVVTYNRRVVEAVLPNRIRPAETPPSNEPVLQEVEHAVELQSRFCRARLGPVRPARLSELAETARALAADFAATAANTAELDPLKLDAHTKTLLAILDRIDLFQQRLSVLLGCPGDAAAAPDQALLLLELRQQRDVFLNGIRDPLDTIRSLSGADVDAGTLTILAAAVRDLDRELADFAADLGGLGEDGQTEEPKNGGQVSPRVAGTDDEHRPTRAFTLLDEFEFVDKCIERAATLTDASSTEIREFRDDHPRLSTVSLLRGEAALRWSWELLRRAEGILIQRGRDLAAIPAPNRGGTKYWAHIYGDGYDDLLHRAGDVVRTLRQRVKNAGDGPFERKVLRELDQVHNRLNDIHSLNRIHYTVYYNPSIIKPRKDEDGQWVTERWYFDTRLAILNEDQAALRDALHSLRNARRAIASDWPRFEGGPRVCPPFRHLAQLRSAQLRDQAEYALATFADDLSAAEGAYGANADRAAHTQAWLTWYRRLLYSPLSGSGALRATRVEKTDDADPNLKFLRREVQKAGRVKTLRNYRDETYKYLQRAEETLK